MTISIRDHKILWARAGNKCSYNYKGKSCNEILAIQNGEDISLIGDEAHIIGKKPGSARYRQNFSEVNTYGNLILLCKKHHKLVDDKEDVYTVDILKEMKNKHEQETEAHIQKGQDKPLIIKDSVFNIHIEDADEGIGMEVNKPAELSNVKLSYSSKNVKNSIGFSTNQGMNIFTITCPKCQKLSRHVFVGTKPSKVKCKNCNSDIETI